MPHKKLICSLVFLSILMVILGSTSYAAEDRVIQARIHLTPEIEIKDIWALQLDIAYVKPGEYLDFVTHGKEVEELRDKGWSVEIIHEDLVSFYRSHLDTTRDMGGYHTYEETGHFLDSMHTEYPAITTDSVTIGYSLENRSIWAFKISDNPEVDEDEPEMLYTGLHHAREPMTIEVLLYYITHLLENYGVDPEVTDLVNNNELWFVPVLNPDGYEYNRQTYPDGGGMWRKNRRDNGDGTFGVDLNRNYGFKWGYDDIGSSPVTNSQTYRGSAPFSEPEIQVVRDFVLAHDFVACINYHSVAELFLLPWGYEYSQPTDFLTDWTFGDSAAFYTGYTAVPGWALYPTNGGATDWHRGEQTLKTKVFGYTCELGRYSFWPPPELIGPICVENLQANLFYARMANRLHDHSIRYIETDPNFYLIDTLIAEDSTLTMSLRIYNHDTSSVMYYDITTPDELEAASVHPLLAWEENADHTEGAGELLASTYSLAPTPFGSSSLLAGDWLKIDVPTGTIAAGSYQDFTITIDGTVIQGSYYGEEYMGAVVIATSNDRTPLYCDTSAVAVSLAVYLEFWDQYKYVHTSDLITSISNNANVGWGLDAGMRYLGSETNFLNEGSFFAAYVSDQGDTIIHRHLYNTHPMRVTSHLDLDSTSDPGATHGHFSTGTINQDLGIIGEVIAPSHPDSSEFFVLKYKVCNMTDSVISPLYLGMVMDWEIGSFMDGSGCDEGLNLIWQKTASNYGGLAYLSQDSAYGASVIDNETYVWPYGDYRNKDLFGFITTAGFHADLNFKDLSSVLSVKIEELAMDDTVEVAYALALSRAGVDGLKETVVGARLFAGVALVRGDVNDDGDIQVSDVVYLINYLLKGGPEPVPVPQVGDVNCDDEVDLADVVYLINYLLKSGPSPCIQ